MLRPFRENTFILSFVHKKASRFDIGNYYFANSILLNGFEFSRKVSEVTWPTPTILCRFPLSRPVPLWSKWNLLCFPQEDLEVPIPRYFVRERIKALKDREKMLAHILAKKGNIEQEPVRIKHFTTIKWQLLYSFRSLNYTQHSR